MGKLFKKHIILKLSLLLLLLTIFFAPKLLQIPMCKNYIVQKVAKKLASSINVDAVQLSWLGPQTLKNVIFANKDVDVSFQSYTVSTNIINFFHNLGLQINNLPSNIIIKKANVSLHAAKLPRADFTDVDLLFYRSILTNEMTIKTKGHSKADQESGIFNIDATINKQKYDINAILEKFPVILIDRFLQKQDLFTNLLGPQMNLKITTQISGDSGPLIVDLSSTNMQAFASAIIFQDKISLKEPFIATLKNISTPLLPNIFAKNPIVLRLSNKNFSLPIRPFDLTKINVDYGMLDMGIISCDNVADLSSLMEMVKSNDKQVDIWFSPIEFSIKNSVLSIQRTDMLINYKMDICLWGDYYLADTKINMNLGLTAQALYAAFKIYGLSEDFVIKIPLSGTIKNIKADTRLATSKITTLMAAKVIKKGGIVGSIIGGIAHGATKGDEGVPPPKRPFPWEGKVDTPTPPLEEDNKVPQIPFNIF
jgi:hypothetical protein